MKLHKSNGILLVVLFASLGYYCTYKAINNYAIQYTVLPSTMPITVMDNQKNASIPKHVVYDLPVHSLLPIDSIKVNKRISGSIKKEDETPILYHQIPIFLIWATLICMMITVAAGSFPVFIAQMIELKKNFNLNTIQFLGGPFYAIVLVFFLYLTIGGNTLFGYNKPDAVINQFNILFSDGAILNYLVFATIILLTPCLALVFLVALASDNIIKDDKIDFIAIKSSVKKIGYLNKKLEAVLQVLAIVIVFSVMTSGALGQSIRAIVKIDGYEIFPKEVSLVYGAYFSLFLCVIYIPVYYYIKLNYELLKDQAAIIEENAVEKGTYNLIFGEVQFKNTPLENVKLALTVLSPLITSILPNHIL